MPHSPDAPAPPQVIPRPAAVRDGSAAPWEDLTSEALRGLSIDRVLAALAASGQSGPVPSPADGSAGGAGGCRWTHVFDPTELEGGAAPALAPVDAAVLVALFEGFGESRVILTRRSSNLRTHRGEVSFPGGRVDVGEDPSATARREAAEEVALDPDAVTQRGWLHPVFTFASGSHITPVVGTLTTRPALRPSPTEVERIFDVALADLVSPGVFHEERWSVPGRRVMGSADGSFPVWFFEVAGETVWGATARILFELLLLVLGLGRAPGLSSISLLPRGDSFHL